MKSSLKNKIALFLIGFVVVLNVVSITMNYNNFVAANNQFSYSTASTVANTCSLILDVDKLDDYIQTGQRDTAYYEMWNKLIDYKNTNKSIEELSVVWFDENGCHYIFDTDLTEQGAFLGDSVVFDSLQAVQKDTLVQGKPIEFIEYAGRMDVYRPVLSSYNIPLGYVIVGISTEEAEMEQDRYLVKLVLLMTLLSGVMLVAITFLFSRVVIKPINTLSEAAANYVDTWNMKTKESALSHLEIKTGDEIEQLFVSVKKMESDLLNISDSLSIATWNSQHDSMTQLYNKRYLEEWIKQHDYEGEVGVIYFDVDNLKKMNDIYGHERGDKVIENTARFILKYQTPNALSFRVGGDEFLMIVRNEPERFVRNMVDEMKKDPEIHLSRPGDEVDCRIAIGYAHGASTQSVNEIIEKADQNMYLDKQSHR